MLARVPARTLKGIVSGPPGSPLHGGSAHPHYTPDGRWFWTGSAWIPSREVFAQEARPPRYEAAAVPRAPRVPERLTRWPLVVAAALLVALLVAGVGDYAAAHRQHPAPGVRNPPSARSILRAPYTHHVGSATFTAVGTTPGRQTATGEILFSPERGYEITERIDGYWADEFLDVGGYAYQRTARGGPWQLQPTYDGEYFYLDWDGAPTPHDLAVNGPVRIRGQRAWHVEDNQGDQWWVGVTSGRPLQALDLGYRFTFSDFGRAPALRPPAPAHVETPTYRAELGQALRTPLLTVTVSDPRLATRLPAGAAPQGYRFLSLQMTVTNDTGQPLGVPLGQPVLTSPQGGEYWQDPAQEIRDLPDGTVPLAPGATEAGTLVFDVEQGVDEVRLLFSSGQLTPDPETQDYLGVVTVPL